MFFTLNNVSLFHLADKGKVDDKKQPDKKPGDKATAAKTSAKGSSSSKTSPRPKPSGKFILIHVTSLLLLSIT